MASPSISANPSPAKGDNKRKAMGTNEEVDSNDERDFNDEGSNTQPGQSVTKKMRTDPPPGSARDIPCLPCISRALETPGHQCRDDHASASDTGSGSRPTCCWHCAHVDKQRKSSCIPIPAEISRGLMEFWTVNSKLAKNHVRDATQQEQVALVTRLLYENRRNLILSRLYPGRSSVPAVSVPIIRRDPKAVATRKTRKSRLAPVPHLPPRDPDFTSDPADVLVLATQEEMRLPESRRQSQKRLPDRVSASLERLTEQVSEIARDVDRIKQELADISRDLGNAADGGVSGGDGGGDGDE